MILVQRFRVSSALVCLAFWARISAADPKIDAVIEKVEQRYNKAKTLTVQFSEQYSVQGHPRPAESGTLTLRKAGKMRWDYSKPAGKVFISDGKMIYLYTAADNKVEQIPLKDTEDMRAPLAFLLGHLDLKKEFQDFTLRPDNGESWLSATAKSSKTPYEKIEMLISGTGEITRLNILGRDESRLLFELTHEQMNPAVSDSLFAFKIPPGAEVVNAVEYAGQDR
jgi:outer membrane lipoprotein carrier protein